MNPIPSPGYELSACRGGWGIGNPLKGVPSHRGGYAFVFLRGLYPCIHRVRGLISGSYPRSRSVMASLRLVLFYGGGTDCDLRRLEAFPKLLDSLRRVLFKPIAEHGDASGAFLPRFDGCAAPVTIWLLLVHEGAALAGLLMEPEVARRIDVRA